MRLLCLLLLSVIFSCLCYNTQAQQKNIVIDSVRYDGGFNYVEEPCISMDFKNPNRLLVFCNPPFTFTGAPPPNAFMSSDGGNTWKPDSVSFLHGDGGDPITIADTNGFFYYIHLGGDDNKIACERLNNFTTHTWNSGSIAGADTPNTDDKPWAAVDRRNNQIYLAYSHYDALGALSPLDSTYILFSKSTDTGNTWSTAVRISEISGDCSNQSNSVEGAMPCAGPQSEIYVAWAHNNAILFNRSFDGGSTWLSTETRVSNSPGGWYYGDIAGIFRSPGLPFIACDNSKGPNRGTVYVNWYDQRNGVGNTDIWVCKSTDSGSTWSSPIKVNDDAGTAEQFMSSMAVDPVTGYIYVLFYDRRNYASADSATDVYLAVSKDGAATFKNYKISETPFYPQKKIFFGDYTCITAYNSVVRPVWAIVQSIATYESDSKIMTAIIDGTITGVGVNELTAQSYNLQTYPNPFSETAYVSCELPEPETVSLFVTDITGRKIAVLRDNELMRAGQHTEQFIPDKNLSPGIYFLCMRSSDFSQTIKMVKTK